MTTPQASSRPAARPGARWLALATAVALLPSLSCSSDDASPSQVPNLSMEFSASELDLGQELEGTVTLRNTGDGEVGPIAVLPSPVRDASGNAISGATLTASPTQLTALAPGQAVDVGLEVELSGQVQSGFYSVSVEALAPEAALNARVAVLFAVTRDTGPGGGDPDVITIAVGPDQLRQGDVVRYEVSDGQGSPVPDSALSWSVEPVGAGAFGPGGRFVGYEPGQALLVATAGGNRDSLVVSITPRGLSGSFAVVGRGSVTGRRTSDLWVHGDFAYSGTHGGGGLRGNTLYTWRIADGGDPRLVDSLQIDAGRLNDVKVRADGALAVATHEGSGDGLNGITILDLADPSAPSPITRFTQGLEPGVHNVWVEGDFVYAAVDGNTGLRVVDISDPTNPTEAAAFHAGFSFIHDVYVREGLAFVSYWNAGLIILDLGNGIAGGSPSNPVEVGRIQELSGQTHNAWYWPERGYAFVGEEDGATGVMHVVDVSDLAAPRKVAEFGVPGDTPHNFWLDESSGVLYAAWYSQGVRALDVTGELMGDLARQDREIAFIQYDGDSGCSSGTCTWAPQLHRGLVYVSDINSGLIVLDPDF